jgi:hypothetical protein
MDLKLLNELRTRLNEILRRHVHEDDVGLSDHEFVSEVHLRYQKFREQAIIDPAE